MNIINKISSCICLLAVGFSGVSCSGNSDETEELALTLKVDKTTLDANGRDAATFTVKQGSTDVSSEATIRCITDGKNLSGCTFSTETPGSYTFEATYKGVTSSPVTLQANEVIAVTSKFVRRVCAMEFTGVWCAECPKNITKFTYLLDSSYKDIVYLMAFHDNGTDTDPMHIDESAQIARAFKQTSYPAFVVDMRQGSVMTIDYAAMRTMFNTSLNDYPAHCGTAISSVYNESTAQAKVTVKITSEKTSEYRLILYAVEDHVKNPQNDGGTWNENYIHRHVVRRLITSSINGDRLGEIAADKEISKEYTVNLDATWNPNEVSFYALVTDADGYINNMSVCEAINGQTDYEYIK